MTGLPHATAAQQLADHLRAGGDQPEPLFDLPRRGDGFDCDLAGLFEGYGGLTMGVQAVLGGELGWYSEIEPAACRLLAHRHPGVCNVGDVTQVDWSTVPRPRVLTGGFPCQDVSSAGRRRGIRPGTRSGLWEHMAYAIDQLRPELVVIENVRGLLSAEAHCDLEPCPWCLGDDEGRPLRALGAVLGDLVQLGYDARWGGLRAADVGAPHGRYRVFVVAYPAGGGRGEGRPQPARKLGGPDAPRSGQSTTADTDGPRRERAATNCRACSAPTGSPPPLAGIGGCGCAASDPDGVGPVRGWSAWGRRRGPADHDLAAADASSAGRGTRRGLHGAGGPPAVGDGAPSPPNPDRDGLQIVREGAEPHARDDADRCSTGSVIDWGQYEPAIRRWELILGRAAPAPTQTGARGGQQLSPRFVEWMQGLPEGWVTAVPGLSPNEQLKMLGNGVVWQQAAAALKWLLADTQEAAA